MDSVLLKRSLGVLWDHLSALKDCFADPLVQEVMINHGRSIWVERAGVMQPLDVVLNDDQIVAAINALTTVNSNRTQHIGDGKLPGLRFAYALSPIATHGPSMSIRKHSPRVLRLGDYTAAGAWNIENRPLYAVEGLECPPDGDVATGGVACEQFLRWVVRARKNLIVSGGTSSGKTTLLNSLLFEVPHDERVLSVEKPAELMLEVPNFVTFEANDGLQVGIRELVQLCLRFRGDRIVLGEVRGAEAFDLMSALATGHPGSAVSLHADSATEALYRLENMIRMSPDAKNWPLPDLRRQIVTTFQYIVQAAHVGGIRTPIQIVRLDGLDQKGEYRFTNLFTKFTGDQK